MKMTFRTVAHGQRFKCNGVEFVKKTSRTARMVSNSRAFYFGALEPVEAMLDTKTKVCYN